MLNGLQQQILRYLRHHPDAKDTAGGILAWWLEGDIPATIDDVEAALDALVAAGYLNASGTPHVRIYGLGYWNPVRNTTLRFPTSH